MPSPRLPSSYLFLNPVPKTLEVLAPHAVVLDLCSISRHMHEVLHRFSLEVLHAAVLGEADCGRLSCRSIVACGGLADLPSRVFVRNPAGRIIPSKWNFYDEET